jgi:hypothetical protein
LDWVLLDSGVTREKNIKKRKKYSQYSLS